MGQRRNKARKPAHRIARPSEGDIEEFKKLLGPEIAARYTRAELVQLNMEFHIGSEILLGLYRQRRGIEEEGLEEV